MNIEISIVPYNKKYLVRNMLQIYLHDMSEFNDVYSRLELNDAGLYEYRYLDHYWTEEGRFPYLITADGRPAGFTLVRTLDDIPTFSIAEFFVAKSYRKTGISKELINYIFLMHKGSWNINAHIKNVAAQKFWREAAKKASNNCFEEIYEEKGRIMWLFRN